MASVPPVILLIGHDPALAHLLERYAQRAGYELCTQTAAALPDAATARLDAVIFASIEELEAAQAVVGHWNRAEFALLVCAAVNDEVRARELGADHCLLHPLTYNGFVAAVAETLAALATRSTGSAPGQHTEP